MSKDDNKCLDSKKHSVRKMKFKDNISVFKCPVCGNKMDIRDMESLICMDGHCFDIARRGYVNLLQNQWKSKYDKNMFEARSAICRLGFFDPMIEQIGNIIMELTNTVKIKILDAGCGEGFHLAQVISYLQNKKTFDIQGLGIDISKEGIQMASRDYPNIIWCVADLAKLPFMKNKFDVVLNILSPANYGEFRQILKQDGVLIKIVPGSSYLAELRSIFYDETDKQSYSNEEVIELFKDNFKIRETQNLKYRVPLNKDSLNQLIEMTPLSWGASDEKIKHVLDSGISKVKVDLTIMVGQK